MQLYAITNRHLLPGSEMQHSNALVELTRQWAQTGVDYIQVREKDLNPIRTLRVNQTDRSRRQK